jgi:phosphoribosylglycinamide formyltransferase 2
MSSSGKGQSLVRSANELESAWQYAQEGGRAGGGRVIVEGFVAFDFEITLLTVRSLDANGDVQTQCCAPIGHRQENGDYQESWQPQAMSAAALQQSQWGADKITASLGGLGLFGVELFVCGDEVIFSEVSPRPHDTGMVTLISQNLSEFALHARAILGLPIAEIELLGASASAVLLPQADSKQLQYVGLRQALAQPGTDLRLFGKPEIHGRRRMGVALAKADTVDAARSKAKDVIAAIETR